MPESKSVFDIYRGAGVAAGKYQSSLYETEDVWGKIESSREMTAFKQEQTGKNIDTLMSAVELSSQIYGGFKAKEEFKGDLGALKEDMGDYKKIGKEGKDWGEMSMWEKMWDEPKYKFGDRTLGKEDITVMAQMKRYGIDIDSPSKSKVVEDIVSKAKEDEFQTTETSPGGQYTAAESGVTETFPQKTDIVDYDKYKLPGSTESEWIVPEIKGAGHKHQSTEGSGSMLEEGLGGKPKNLTKEIDELLKQLEGQGLQRPESREVKKPEPLFGGGGQVWQD